MNGGTPINDPAWNYQYEAARTPEARIAKALDKLETILHHTQGDRSRDR